MRQDASSADDCQQPASSGLRSSCAPVPSGSVSPKLRRRTASGSSAGSEVRQSLELEGAMTAQARPLANASRIPVLQSDGPRASTEDEPSCQDAKCSSGPIAVSGPNGSPVRRTRSLKEQLINKFSSAKRNAAALGGQPPPRKSLLKDESPKAQEAEPGLSSDEFDHQGRPTSSRASQRVAPPADAAANHASSRSSSPKKIPHDSSQEDLAQARQSGASTPTKQSAAGRAPAGRPPQQLNRNRAGSLRGNPVVKVLPDRQLLSKASSSENISQQADLTNLTSLVQKKRDRSQDSLDQGAKTHSSLRKPPTPTSLDSDDGSDTAKSKPPTGKPRKTDSPTGRFNPVDDASHEAPDAVDTDRESPAEDQHSDSDALGAGSGQNRSNSLEMLIQSRTAPQIRHPSARPGRMEAARRDWSPSKLPSSSPPKAVSFNLNHEVNTFEGESRQRRRHSHRARKPEGHERNGDARTHEATGSKIGDNALIEVHCTLVETMENTINKQRSFLNQVRDGGLSVTDYREIMKTLLQMQTKTIQQIVDTIQSNENSV